MKSAAERERARAEQRADLDRARDVEKRRLSKLLEATDAAHATAVFDRMRADRAEDIAIEAAAVAAYRKAVDPIVARLLEEPTHRDARALAAAHVAGADRYLREVGRSIGGRLIAVRLVGLVRPDEADGFGVNSPWMDGAHGAILTHETALDRACAAGDPSSVRDAFSALAVGVRRANATPTAAGAAMWQARQRTCDGFIIAEAGAAAKEAEHERDVAAVHAQQARVPTLTERRRSGPKPIDDRFGEL